MSYGSRAARQNLMRLSSCSEQLPETAFFAGDRRSMSARAKFPNFPHGSFIAVIAGLTAAPVRNRVPKYELRERVGQFWQ
jgi:hypothetical protein